jgi:hypothetical protein
LRESFPLLLDRDVGAAVALLTSFRVVAIQETPRSTFARRPAVSVTANTLYAFMWRQRERGVIPFATNRDLRRTWQTLAGKAGVPKEIRDRITAAMLPTVALAAHTGGGFGAGNYPQPGTYNWPPYTETNCRYVLLNSHRQTGYGQWVYRCH